MDDTKQETFPGLEIEIQQILSDGRQQIIEAAAKQVAERCRWDMADEIDKKVRATVSQYMEAEIVPEIQASLQDKKALILKEINDSIARIAKAANSLAGYQGNDIIKKIFGGY